MLTNGIPPYGRSGSPARFTPNIAKSSQYWDNHHWHENFNLGKASLLGTNQGPKPYVLGINEYDLNLDLNFENLPFKGSDTKIQILSEKEIGFKTTSAFKKPVAGGIAYDRVNDEFAIIGVGGSVYFTDDEFKEAKNYAIIDQVNGMDAPISVGASYFGSQKVVATAYSKTIWGVMNSDEIDEKVQRKYLRKVNGNLMLIFNRSRASVMTTRLKKPIS